MSSIHWFATVYEWSIRSLAQSIAVVFLTGQVNKPPLFCLCYGTLSLCMWPINPVFVYVAHHIRSSFESKTGMSVCNDAWHPKKTPPNSTRPLLLPNELGFTGWLREEKWCSFVVHYLWYYVMPFLCKIKKRERHEMITRDRMGGMRTSLWGKSGTVGEAQDGSSFQGPGC